jgi:hypothetical protein
LRDIPNEILSRVWLPTKNSVAAIPRSAFDQQADKIDLAFALNPYAAARTCDRLLPRPRHPFGFVARRGFTARTKAALTNPGLRAVSLIGSRSHVLLARYAPNAQVVGAKAGDDAIVLIHAGRADATSTR